MEGRDDKGKFVEGNTHGFSSTESAREGQRLSSIAQKANNAEKKRMRKWAEVFGALPTSVTLPNATRMDTDMDGAVVFGQYQQAIQRGNTKAAYFIAGLKGELEENININNVTPQVVVDNEMTAEKLAKIMSREDVHNEGVQ